VAGSADDQLGRLGALAGAYGETELAAEADTERGRLAAAHFFVACVGQFKRGKTTLINALVGEPILPAGVLPVTAVVTVLRYDDDRSITVQFTDGRTEASTAAALADYVDERRNVGNARGVAAIDVRLRAPILRDGLCLVDTPGVGSVHATNTAVTNAFLPRVDVALLVAGPDPPLAATELDLVRIFLAEARSCWSLSTRQTGSAATSGRSSSRSPGTCCSSPTAIVSRMTAANVCMRAAGGAKPRSASACRRRGHRRNGRWRWQPRLVPPTGLLSMTGCEPCGPIVQRCEVADSCARLAANHAYLAQFGGAA
jgi:Dynamin family